VRFHFVSPDCVASRSARLASGFTFRREFRDKIEIVAQRRNLYFSVDVNVLISRLRVLAPKVIAGFTFARGHRP